MSMRPRPPPTKRTSLYDTGAYGAPTHGGQQPDGPGSHLVNDYMMRTNDEKTDQIGQSVSNLRQVGVVLSSIHPILFSFTFHLLLPLLLFFTFILTSTFFTFILILLVTVSRYDFNRSGCWKQTCWRTGIASSCFLPFLSSLTTLLPPSIV
jgi:hypothetical protein